MAKRRRQAELENAMRRTGGIRASGERELSELRTAFAKCSTDVAAVTEAASRTHRLVAVASVEHVERLMHRSG